MSTSFASPEQSTKTHHKRNRASTQGLVFGIIFLLVIVGIWIGMKLYLGSLESVNNELVEKVETAHQQYEPVVVSDVMDFSERLEIVNSVNASHDSVMIALLFDLEAVMVPRVVLSLVDLERSVEGENHIRIEGDADEFDILAQQELAMRESGDFTDLIMGDTSIDDAGRKTFMLDATYIGALSQE